MATGFVKTREFDLPVAKPAVMAGNQVHLMGAALARARSSLPFRAVNRRDKPDYDPGFQRHHLLPRQLLSQRCFGPLLDEIGRDRIGFDDFRSNGLLLPASDAAAVRIGLPLHRGPHRDYNAMVIERVGQVEASWSAVRLRAPEIALDEAVERLRLLQRALRRRLLDPVRKRFALNRHDPLGKNTDFAALDSLVDSLWPATEPALETLGSSVAGVTAEPLPVPLFGAPASASDLALIVGDDATEVPYDDWNLVTAARSALAC